MDTGQADMGIQQGKRQENWQGDRGTNRGGLAKWPGNRQGRSGRVTREPTVWQGRFGKVGQNEQRSSTRTTSGTRRTSRWYARPFCSSTQKTFCFYFLGSVNTFLLFCVLPLLISKNGHCNFSQAFCSCRICVKSGLPNFWSNAVG